jgi:hypothetical protein
MVISVENTTPKMGGSGKTLVRPVVSKEHGAWAMLSVSFAIGLGVAAQGYGRAMVFLALILSLHLARYPLSLMLRAGRRRGPNGEAYRRWAVWFGIYLTSGLILAAILLLAHRLWLLALLGAAALIFLALHLWLGAVGSGRSVAGELLGISGLALSAPGAYYVASGSLDERVLLLWALTLLYFGGSVFYVKMRIDQETAKAGPPVLRVRLFRGMGVMIYHSLALVVVSLLACFRAVPPLLPIAFLPPAVKAFKGTLEGRSEMKVKTVGFIEVAYSAAFAAMTIWAYHVR